MKCTNCNVVIDQRFEHAIRSNSCPGCGKNIMPPEKLAAYIGLQELIKTNFPEIESEKVANLIVANFELKQLFKESSVKEQTAPEKVEVEVSEDESEISDKEYDEIHKAKQAKEARAQLKKMKEEAYESALRGQFGMDESESDMFGEGTGTVELVNRMQQEQRQSESQNKMLSGVGGFRRSDV